MPKTIVRYSVQFGLSGCYLPDSEWGPLVCTTRKELSEAIRDCLHFYELPASLFRQVKIKNLWGYIAMTGASNAHFNLHHKHYTLSFTGLTEEEANELDKENQ